METSLTPGIIAALLTSMLVLSFMPSVSVLTVAARSSAYGFRHGFFATLGIIAGDIFFIIIAIYGLSILTDLLFLLLVFIHAVFVTYCG